MGGLVRQGFNYYSAKKRGLHLASKCPFCGKEEEELEHILIHCTQIWGQWIDLLSAFGTAWVAPFLVKDLILTWMLFPTEKEKWLWKAAPLIVNTGNLERKK